VILGGGLPFKKRRGGGKDKVKARKNQKKGNRRGEERRSLLFNVRSETEVDGREKELSVRSPNWKRKLQRGGKIGANDWRRASPTSQEKRQKGGFLLPEQNRPGGKGPLRLPLAEKGNKKNSRTAKEVISPQKKRSQQQQNREIGYWGKGVICR